jgi:L-iditol 2-dehydrogenase
MGTAETMQASVLERQGVVTERAVPRPELDPDQVLVQVAAVGICGSDVHYFHDGRIGDFVVEEPMILGHEAAGVIVEVGSAVSPSRIGERVSIEPQRACRVCDQCKLGRYNLCRTIEFYATPPIDGAFAEFAAIQADFAHPIPDSMSLEAAALCEPLSVGIWANQKAGTAPGSRVLIAGAGPIGIIAAQVARAFGATDVIVSDPVAPRRDGALRFGATAVLDPMAGEQPATEVDVFIDASGAAPAVRQGILALAPGGRAVLVGMGPDEFPLPVGRIQLRELVVTGVFRYANTWPLAISLAARGAVDLDSLVTARYGLAEVETALQRATDASMMKVLVVPGAE